MLHNVLIAVDGSRNSLRAVEYTGRVFAPNAEARLVLFHVLPAISRMSLNQEEMSDEHFYKDKKILGTNSRTTQIWKRVHLHDFIPLAVNYFLAFSCKADILSQYQALPK